MKACMDHLDKFQYRKAKWTTFGRIFLCRPSKKSFLCKTFYIHMECADVHTNFFSKKINIGKIYFPTRCICHRLHPGIFPTHQNLNHRFDTRVSYKDAIFIQWEVTFLEASVVISLITRPGPSIFWSCSTFIGMSVDAWMFYIRVCNVFLKKRNLCES